MNNTVVWKNKVTENLTNAFINCVDYVPTGTTPYAVCTDSFYDQPTVTMYVGWLGILKRRWDKISFRYFMHSTDLMRERINAVLKKLWLGKIYKRNVWWVFVDNYKRQWPWAMDENKDYKYITLDFTDANDFVYLDI